MRYETARIADETAGVLWVYAKAPRVTTLASRVGSHGIQQRLRAANLQAGALLAQLEDLPIGNVLYTRVLLDDVEAGRQLLDDLAALPRAMDEIYHNFLLRLDFGGAAVLVRCA